MKTSITRMVVSLVIASLVVVCQVCFCEFGPWHS
jgi:hypothetical protein